LIAEERGRGGGGGGGAPERRERWVGHDTRL
jgi:hypothetical protein